MEMEYCDRCGPAVRALVFVEMPDRKELAYCGHHADQYMDKLVLLGCEVLDTRQPIEAR